MKYKFKSNMHMVAAHQTPGAINKETGLTSVELKCCRALQQVQEAIPCQLQAMAETIRHIRSIGTPGHPSKRPLTLSDAAPLGSSCQLSLGEVTALVEDKQVMVTAGVACPAGEGRLGASTSGYGLGIVCCCCRCGLLYAACSWH